MRRTNPLPDLDIALAQENYAAVENIAVDALRSTKPNTIESSDVLTRYGIALQRLSRYEQAERALSQAANIRNDLRVNDETSYNALLYLGHTLRRLNDDQEAIDTYREAIELIAPYLGHDWPRLLEAWIPMARTMADLGQGDEALQAAHRAVEIVERMHGRDSGDAAQAREFVHEIETALEHAEPMPSGGAAEELLGEERSVSITPLPRTDPNPALVDDILAELDRMIGLASVKKQARSLVNFIRVQQARQEAGAKPIPRTYHMVFTGNPGTGKTTVARVFARIFHALGILASENMTEGDRSSLVAGYIGQSAQKTHAFVDKALDGCILIDEAYSLAGESKEDFGHEAIAALLLRMENDRSRLVVIMAGYEEQMKVMIASNPGLKSRFQNVIRFEDYSAEELEEIFNAMAADQDYYLAVQAQQRVKALMQRLWEERGEDFANARDARNLFEASVAHQANRIVNQHITDPVLLSRIEAEDIPVNPRDAHTDPVGFGL